jgi:hypothetical protein
VTIPYGYDAWATREPPCDCAYETPEEAEAAQADDYFESNAELYALACADEDDDARDDCWDGDAVDEDELIAAEEE